METSPSPLGAFIGFWMFIKLISLLGVAVAVIYGLYCLTRIASQLQRIADAQERQDAAPSLQNSVMPAVVPTAPIPTVLPPLAPAPPPPAPQDIAPPPPAPPAPPSPPPVPRTTMPGAPHVPPVEAPREAGPREAEPNGVPERPRDDI